MMSNWPPEWLRDYPPGVHDALHAALHGGLEPPIVLTRLFLVLGNEATISCLLERAASELQSAGDRAGVDRMRRISELAQRDAGVFAQMREILALLHGGSAGRRDQASPSLAAAFDKAAAISPAASVALYSLGDSALLQAATEEIVILLRAHRLISPASRVLEIGCGIGRFARALAGDVHAFTGIDISENMIRIARAHCTGLPNVAFALTAGVDLQGFPDGGFDLVLAVDSFPYIVAAEPGLAELHLRESARVLTARGSLTIFNFSYEENFEASREWLLREGRAVGLHLVTSDPAPLRSWDGNFFHFRRQSSAAQNSLVELSPPPMNLRVLKDG